MGERLDFSPARYILNEANLIREFADFSRKVRHMQHFKLIWKTLMND